MIWLTPKMRVGGLDGDGDGASVAGPDNTACPSSSTTNPRP